MSAQTAGPDIEGVLGRHVLTNSFTTIEGFKAASCSCGEAAFPVEWMGMRWEVEARLHRAHVAAALRAEVGRWLGSEGAVADAANALCWHLTERDFDGGCTLACGYSGDDRDEHLAAAALAALAEQVGAEGVGA